MDRTDLITTPNVEGEKIKGYLGVVYTRENSADKVFDEIVKQGNDLNADYVVGFSFIQQSPKRFYAFGTAVKTETIN